MEIKNGKIRKVFLVAFVAAAFLKVNFKFKKQANFLVKAMEAPMPALDEETKIENFKKGLELEENVKFLEKKIEQIDSDLNLDLNDGLSEDDINKIKNFFENIKNSLENLLNAVKGEEIWKRKNLNEIYNHFNKAFDVAIKSLLDLLKDKEYFFKYVMYIGFEFLLYILKHKFRMQLLYENVNDDEKPFEENFKKVFKEMLKYCEDVSGYGKKDFLSFCVLVCFYYVTEKEVIEDFLKLPENSNLKKVVQECLDAIIEEQQKYGEEYSLFFFKVSVITDFYFLKGNIIVDIENFKEDGDYASLEEDYFKSLLNFFTNKLRGSFLDEKGIAEEKNFNIIYKNLNNAFLEKAEEIVKKIVEEKDNSKKDLLKNIAANIVWWLINVRMYYKIAKKEQKKSADQQMCAKYLENSFNKIFNCVLDGKDEEKKKVYFEIFKCVAAEDYEYAFKTNCPNTYEGSDLEKAVKVCLTYIEKKETTKLVQVETKVKSAGDSFKVGSNSGGSFKVSSTSNSKTSFSTSKRLGAKRVKRGLQKKVTRFNAGKKIRAKAKKKSRKNKLAKKKLAKKFKKRVLKRKRKRAMLKGNIKKKKNGKRAAKAAKAD